jgi:hypothetical protein
MPGRARANESGGWCARLQPPPMRSRKSKKRDASRRENLFTERLSNV